MGPEGIWTVTKVGVVHKEDRPRKRKTTTDGGPGREGEDGSCGCRYRSTGLEPIPKVSINCPQRKRNNILKMFRL